MGAAVGFGLLFMLLLGIAVGCFGTRSRLRPTIKLQERQLAIKEGSIGELRKELLEDKGTNRKLRYLLAQCRNGDNAGSAFTKHRKLNEAQTEIQRLSSELAVTSERLSERDNAMRVTRATIQEIRQQLEGANSIWVQPGDQLAPAEVEFVEKRLASLEDVTGEINLQR